MSGEFDDDAPQPVIVPRDALPPEVVSALLEEFASRDGTDYGSVERSLAEKVADLRRQLERGEIGIVFDPGSETTTLVPARELPGG